MQTLRVDPGSIFIGKRHRSLSEDAVSRLVESIKTIGLKQPISIRVVDEMEVDGVLTAGVPVLVAGRHRLEAVKQLGWTHVDCFELGDDELTAELWELAENLHRHDLTKEQRDEHIRRYAELLELQSRQTVVIESKRADGRGHRREGAAAKIARDTGLSKRTVERALNPKPTPLPVSDLDVADNQFRALMAAWNRAGTEARDRFVREIELEIAA